MTAPDRDSMISKTLGPCNRLLRGLALLCGVVTFTGCSTIRADIGVGFGFGASAQVPGLLRTGYAAGKYFHVGHDYDDGWSVGNPPGTLYSWEPSLAQTVDVNWDWAFTMLILHREQSEDDLLVEATYSASDKYETFFLLPALFGTQPLRAERGYALEVQAMLGLVDVRLGWNPYFLITD